MNLPSLSLNPRYHATSAWWQHVPVAHWLVDVIKPDTIVELGAHYGVSFFAFCEAAEAFSSNTFVFAVDTWEGDEHAGSYSEDVYHKVVAHWADFHRKRSRLVRSTFDDAVGYFEDQSIDILHIDGLHTYEAVAHDFEAWLPKLKDNSVVLFHDINVRERNFGVWKFWAQLKADSGYLAIELFNGHGLGILVKGSCYKDLLNDSANVLQILASKGELVEKLSELRTHCEHARAEAGQARVGFEQARAEAEQARAEAEQARAEAEQARAEVEQARAEAEQARAEVEQARAEADLAKGDAELAMLQSHHIQEELGYCQLALLQSRHIQEELEHCQLNYRFCAEKLAWHRGQREVLIRTLRAQARNLRGFMAVNTRAVLK